MAQFGVNYSWKGNTLKVPEQNYLPLEFTVEADWSGASYWYQILALAKQGEILLENLKIDSIQGDAKIAAWFHKFGIHSVQKEKGVLLSKKVTKQPGRLELDFIENPDMAQTMVCLCIARKIPFHFSGLKTLKIKETDRIDALKTELAKFGAILTEPKPGELFWNGDMDFSVSEKNPVIKTYHDHRMALAFAPLALAGFPVKIENPEVVTKSYPRFWEDLKKAGFQVTAVP